MNKNIKYFIGKVCTVFTIPINRNFKEENPQTYPEQLYFYFTGVVEDVDEKGILITQVMGEGLKSYFFLNSVVGIAEEKVLNPSNEQDAKEINAITQANEEMQKQLDEFKVNPNEYLDAEEMSVLLKKLRQNQ